MWIVTIYWYSILIALNCNKRYSRKEIRPFLLQSGCLDLRRTSTCRWCLLAPSGTPSSSPCAWGGPGRRWRCPRSLPCCSGSPARRGSAPQWPGSAYSAPCSYTHLWSCPNTAPANRYHSKDSVRNKNISWYFNINIIYTDDKLYLKGTFIMYFDGSWTLPEAGKKDMLIRNKQKFIAVFITWEFSLQNVVIYKLNFSQIVAGLILYYFQNKIIAIP